MNPTFRYGLRLLVTGSSSNIFHSQTIQVGLITKALRNGVRQRSSFVPSFRQYPRILPWIGGGVSLLGICKMMLDTDDGKPNWTVLCKPQAYEDFKRKHLLGLTQAALLLLDDVELDQKIRAALGEMYGNNDRKLHSYILMTGVEFERILSNTMDGEMDRQGKDKWDLVGIAGERLMPVHNRMNAPLKRAPATYYWLPGRYNVLQCYYDPNTQRYQYAIGEGVYVLVSVEEIVNNKGKPIRRPNHLEGVSSQNFANKRAKNQDNALHHFESDYPVIEYVKGTLSILRPYCPKIRNVIPKDDPKSPAKQSDSTSKKDNDDKGGKKDDKPNAGKDTGEEKFLKQVKPRPTFDSPPGPSSKS